MYVFTTLFVYIPQFDVVEPLRKEFVLITLLFSSYNPTCYIVGFRLTILNNQTKPLDYVVNYENICFRVNYTFDSENPEFIVFAAQPFEMLETDESYNVPSGFLMYGRIDFTTTINVGFKAFSFVITEELHARMGQLYKEIKAEFFMRYNERKGSKNTH
jgi:hypothetical protein